MPTDNHMRTKASNCALLTISVICMCVLVMCGVMIVREYSLSMAYKGAMCTVASITKLSEIECRYCGTNKKDGAKKKGARACQMSSFPCVEVMVSFNGMSGVMHVSSIQAASKHHKCSFDTCEKTPAENLKLTEDFLAEYRVKLREGSTFKCYYNKYHKQELISTKKHSTNDVIHSMLWPSLIILVCGVIFFRLEMKRRGLNFCASNLPDQIGYGGDAKFAVTNAPQNYEKQVMVAKYKMAGDPKVEHMAGPPAACPLLRHQDNGKIMSSSLSSLDRIAKHNDPRLLQAKQGMCGSHTQVNRLTPEPWKSNVTSSVDRIKDVQGATPKQSKDSKDGNKQAVKSSPAIPKIQVKGPNERTESFESQGSSKSIRAETPV